MKPTPRPTLADKLAEVGASARKAAAAKKRMEDAKPKSHKGTGRVPAKLRGAPQARPEFVVRAEVGTYRAADGSKVRGNRATRRAAGQRRAS